jgi:hypothetical protein
MESQTKDSSNQGMIFLKILTFVMKNSNELGGCFETIMTEEIYLKVNFVCFCINTTSSGNRSGQIRLFV